MCSKRSPGVVPWARSAASVLRVENEPSMVQNCPTSTRFVAGRLSKTVSAVLRRRSSRVLMTCRAGSRTSSKSLSHHHVAACTVVRAWRRSVSTVLQASSPSMRSVTRLPRRAGARLGGEPEVTDADPHFVVGLAGDLLDRDAGATLFGARRGEGAVRGEHEVDLGLFEVFGGGRDGAPAPST
jgi:hypothetical protein